MDNERMKPASSRTENLPELLSIIQLEAFLLENFPKHPRVKWYFVTPEELCDIVEKYANVIQAHWKEGANPPLANQMVWVTLFNKGRSGANIQLTGLLEFTPQYAKTYCKNEGIDPAMWGVQGKFAHNFKGARGNEVNDAYYEQSYRPYMVDADTLWANICTRREMIKQPNKKIRKSPYEATSENAQVTVELGQSNRKKWWQFWK